MISFFMDIYSSSLSINQKIQEINDKKWLPKSITTYGSLESVKNDILIYYEYSQFKRTYFDSTGETKYDKKTYNEYLEFHKNTFSNKYMFYTIVVGLLLFFCFNLFTTSSASEYVDTKYLSSPFNCIAK